MLTQAWDVLHVLASTVFLGDILTTFVWNARAARSRDPQVRAFASELVVLTDRWLLTPAVGVLVVTGNVTALTREIPLWTNPLLAGAVTSFMLSGVIWAVFLVPVQKRQAAMAPALRAGGVVTPEYDALARRWIAWAPAALGAAALALVLMAFA